MSTGVLGAAVLVLLIAGAIGFGAWLNRRRGPSDRFRR